MAFLFNFGRFLAGKAKAVPAEGGRFRLAVLGDFSARAQRGELARGSALAERKPIKIDVDNFDQTLQRLKVKLTLQLGEGAVELEIASLDDFNPEQLFEKLKIFSELSGLRRRLKSTTTFAKAAAEVQQWPGAPAAPGEIPPARGSVVQTEGELDDFAQLLGQPAAAAPAVTPVEELLRQIVGPHIVAAQDPRQEALVGAVDEALSATLRRVLHHPDFQALEALWRGLDLLVRRLETGPRLEVVLLDLTAEELASELSSGEALEESGLYKMLVEQPALDAHHGAYAALVAHYTFARTRAHAELLGRLARIASAIPAAVVTAMTPELLVQKPEDLPPEVSGAWTALGALPEAGYLALLTPSFLLRQPYGRRSEPVDCFDFEEITPATGLRGFLWGNPAVLAGLLLGETSTADGRQMKPGSQLVVGDLPFYYFTDQHGDQEALPCTEKAVTSREAAVATSQGFIPVVGLKGSPEVRLGGFQSIAGNVLAGPWAPLTIAAPAVAAPPFAEAAAPPADAQTSMLEPSGDSELDALLAGLDAQPAEAAPPPPAESGESELDAMLAGLETPAETPAPAAESASGDADLDAMLAGLESTPEPAPATADPDLDAMLAGLEETEPPAAEAPQSEEPLAATEEPEAPDSTGDAELDALIASLSPEAPAPPAQTKPGDLDPALAELLAGL